MAKTTSKYGFNLPDGGDMVSPAPYNENFKKIEKVLSRIDKINVVKGTYIGDGDIKTHGVEAVQSIELGARPCLVWIGRKGGESVCTLTFGCDTAYSEHERTTYTTEEHIRARITDNGFDVIQYGFFDKSCVNDTQPKGLNRSGDEYYYIALFSDELDGTDAEAEYANVDPYTMVFREDVTSLPSAAATGEVYRIANDIYSDVVVAVSGVSSRSSDGYILTVNISDTDTEFYRFFHTLYHKYYSLGVISLDLNTYGQYVAIELQGVGEDYIKFGVANADVGVGWFTDGMHLSFRATDEIKEYASLEYACGECVCYVDGVWKRLGAEAVPYLVKRLADLEDAIAGGELAGETSDGFRKIGFTEDCDFVATAEDGLTAFKDALDAASDGETFVVMPGTYSGSDTLTIAKNVSFVGVGMPTIEFPISVYGEGEFDFGTGDIITPIVTYATNWAGIHFTNSVIGFKSQNYNSPLAYSAVNSENCIFNGIKTRFVGNHFRSKITFSWSDGSTVSLGSDFDPAEGCVFESCDLIFENEFSSFIKAKNCNVFFEFKSVYGECSYIFENCNIYNYNNVIINNGQYVSTFVVSNCNIFGSKFYSSATASGNYLFSGTAL